MLILEHKTMAPLHHARRHKNVNAKFHYRKLKSLPSSKVAFLHLNTTHTALKDKRLFAAQNDSCINLFNLFFLTPALHSTKVIAPHSNPSLFLSELFEINIIVPFNCGARLVVVKPFNNLRYRISKNPRLSLGWSWPFYNRAAAYLLCHLLGTFSNLYVPKTVVANWQISNFLLIKNQVELI